MCNFSMQGDPRMSPNEHDFSVMPFPLNHVDASPQLSLNVPNDQPRLPSLRIDQDFQSRPSEELARASSRQFYPTDYPQDSRFQNSSFSQPNPGAPVRYPESSQRTCLQDDRAGNPMAIGSVYSGGIADVGGQGLVGSPSEYIHSTGRNDTRGPSDLYPPSLNDTPSPVSLNVLPFSERLDKIPLPHGHVPPHSFYQLDSMPYGPSIPPLPGPKVLTGVFGGLPNLTVFEVQHQNSRRRYSSELPQMDSGDDINTQPYTPTSPRPQNLVIDNVCCATPSSLSSIPMSNSSGWLRSQPLAPSSAFDAKSCNPIMASSLIGHSSASPISDSDSAHMVPGSSSEQSEQTGRQKKKKKSKMHDCEVCGKSFPRPSGLQTHMNTHSNAKPFACGFPGCTRTFGVRSNAKRHLRTHGIIPSSSQDGDVPYVVGFSTPIVSPPPNPERQLPNDEKQHQTSQPPFFKLRWMPQSLASRTNAASLSSVSPSDDFSEDENDSDLDNMGSGSSSTTLLSIPLPAVEPTVMRPSRPCSCSYLHRFSTNTPCRCMPMTFESSSSSSSSSADSPSSLSTSTSGTASADDDFFQYEERNSYVETGSHPYHPSQFCVLPGPAPRVL